MLSILCKYLPLIISIHITYIDKFRIERRLGFMYAALLLLPIQTYNIHNIYSTIYIMGAMIDLIRKREVYTNPLLVVCAQIYGFYGSISCV